jgi:hypothetical protein
LTLNGAANVNLGIPANEVKIGSNAQGASLNADANIGTLHNQGSDSNITIGGTVGSIETDGANSNINVVQGASVGSININGESTSVSGEGEVSEVNVNADGCSIDTANTVVNVGNARGTRIRGIDPSEGTNTNTDRKDTPGVTPITAIGSITGTPRVGAELTAGALTPAEATVAYQWSISDTISGTYANIPGAVSSTYTPAAGDVGKYIKVTAAGTGDYSGSVTSIAAGPTVWKE